MRSSLNTYFFVLLFLTQAMDDTFTFSYCFYFFVFSFLTQAMDDTLNAQVIEISNYMLSAGILPPAAIHANWNGGHNGLSEHNSIA